MRNLSVTQRQALLVVALFSAGALLNLIGHYVTVTLGIACYLLALFACSAQIARREGPFLPAQRLAPLVIILVAAGLLWPLLLGQMPLSQDHPIHLARAWMFVHERLFEGKLSGWSDSWFAGWPAGEDYPPGADYWISAFHLATFGLLGWSASYALAFVAMFALTGLAIYRFGLVTLGRTSGFCAALFYLLDRGAFREGGWAYTVHWGVWPQVLSTGFMLLALSLLDPVIRRGRARDYLLCAGAAGYALLCHPMAALGFGLAVPLYLLVFTLTEGDIPAGRVVARALAALGLGGLLSAYWFLPFSAKSGWMATYGELWKPLDEIASGLLQGNVYENLLPPIIWLAFLGATFACLRRHSGGIFILVFGAALLFLSSSTAFESLELARLSRAFEQVQFQRLAIIAKVAFMLLAGFAIQELFTAWRSRPVDQRLSGRRWHALVACVALACSPFVLPLYHRLGDTYAADLGSPTTAADVKDWQSYQEFLAWSQTLERKEFFRIAYNVSYHNHLFGSAIAYNEIPAYKAGYTPATNFTFKPDQFTPELLRVLSVKYVVSRLKLSEPFELEKTFGRFYVYRYRDYTPTRYTLEGPGSVTVKEFGLDAVTMEVSGAEANSRLILHRANYANWVATHNGQPLPIHTTTLAEQKGFIGVPAKNGTIHFRYTWPTSNRIGAILSWLALLVMATMAIGARRPSLNRALERLRPVGRAAERHGLWIGAGLLALALAGKLLVRKEAVADSLLAHFDRISMVVKDAEGKETPCARKDKTILCGKASARMARQSLGVTERRCLRLPLPDKATLEVRFSGVTLGRVVRLAHGFGDDDLNKKGATATPVEVAVSAAGQALGTTSRRATLGWRYNEFDTSALRGTTTDLVFSFSSNAGGDRGYCIDPEVAEW